MPELPEVETLRRTIQAVLPGRTILAVQVLWARTVEPLTPAEMDARIAGRTVIGTDRAGKLLILELDDGAALTVHLRMTGELLFRPDRTRPRDGTREAYLRAVFHLSGNSELCFYDTRKFGRVGYVPPGNREGLMARRGVEPLGKSFSIDRLSSLLVRKRSIKSLLLDQSVVAGLGNIYVDEALFRAGIHPLRVASTLTQDEVERLHDSIITVLSEAIEHRGTTLRDYRSGLGDAGENQHRLHVYGRANAPCVTCGTLLERLVVAQRGTVHCPRCQPLTQPGTLRQSPPR